MDFYGLSWAVSFLLYCCFLYVELDIQDGLYGVYFSCVYFIIELILLFFQYLRNKR